MVSYWLNNVWLIPHFAIHQMPRKLQMITAKTTQMTMVSLMTTIAASRTLRVIPRRSPRTKRGKFFTLFLFNTNQYLILNCCSHVYEDWLGYLMLSKQLAWCSPGSQHSFQYVYFCFKYFSKLGIWNIIRNFYFTFKFGF